MKLYLIPMLFCGILGSAFAQSNETQDDVAIIKTNLSESKEKIKKYEWIETTTVSYKGEQKSKKQNQCYYGVDGKLYKVATGDQAAPKQKGGLRGKIAENKKESIEDYIEKAIAKVQTYLPPDPQKIQQLYQAGKVAVTILEPGKKFKLDFPGYNQDGDMLSITIDKEKKLLMGMSVSTYIDDPGDKVIFNVTYTTLPDGTQYPAQTSLDAQAKEVKIVIENSGHKKGAD